MKGKQSGEREEKGEGKGRREGAGGRGKQGVGRGRHRAGSPPSRAPCAALGGAAAELYGQRISPSAERGRERERGGEERETPRGSRARPSHYCMCPLLGGSPA